MKNLKKYLLATMAITTLVLILAPLNSYAALQSNPNTHYKTNNKKGTETWMVEIRQMEVENSAMGLSEQLEEDLTPKKDDDGNVISNNIDVHMMRSTEYGAIAILSTSGYGNPNTMKNSTPEKSTTGNKTGVYYTTDGRNNTWAEVVAGGFSGYIFKDVNLRYYDSYTNNSKVGDAMDLRWQEITGENAFPKHNMPSLQRNNGGYFRYYFNSIGTNLYARGVAVCGAGF